MLLVGGNVNNTANAGVGYFNVNNGLGNVNANIGARLTKEVKHRILFLRTGFTGEWISARVHFSNMLERVGHTSARFPEKDG